jgi:regulatory protein
VAGSDGRLARVSYLPGVLPPSSDDGRTRHSGTGNGSGTENATGHDAEVGVGAGDELPVKDSLGWAIPGGGPKFVADDPEDEIRDGGTRDDAAPVDGAPRRTGGRTAPGDRKTRRAENVSMSALTRRGMSRRELERVLVARELDDATVAAELDRLQGVGLIDDRALAEDLVSRLRDRKGLGRSAVASELSRRMLPTEVIAEALDTIESDDELETARELAVRRAGQLRSLDRETAERRLSGFLQRRGYSGEILRTVVREALAGSGGGDRPSGVTFR